MNFGDYLTAFAQNLAPDYEEVLLAKSTIDEISHIIKEGFKGSNVVNRIMLTGSLSKETSIKRRLDIDINVYVNLHPPFDGIITEFHKIVLGNFQHCLVHQDRYGIKFFRNGFKVDLLPAVNFLPHGFMGDAISVQHQLALQYVKTVPKEMRRYYYTSLSGASVLFANRRNSFSRSLCRLAKYWSLKLKTVNIQSRSIIMEYMATYVADQLTHIQIQDIVEGFRRFLWLFISPNFRIYWLEFYNVYDIPVTKMTHLPLLLDPCNPYNNILHRKRNIDCQMTILRLHAQNTLARLNEAEMAFTRGIQVNVEAILGEGPAHTPLMNIFLSTQGVIPFYSAWGAVPTAAGVTIPLLNWSYAQPTLYRNP